MFTRFAIAIILVITTLYFEANIIMVGVEQGIGFIPKSWSTIWWCLFTVALISLAANYLVAWILADA